MRGIIMIDVITYLIALMTLIFVAIPQPEKPKEKKEKLAIGQDIVFGWRYLAERRGLLGILLYFAGVNFFANICGVMIGPLVLSFGEATNLGVAQSVMGLGMLGGSLIMSMWGGPKQKKINAVIGFIFISALGFLVAGLKPALGFVSAGVFILMFFIPFASGPSSAIFAAKVAPEVQGRVFATRSMIAQSMMPLAFILSGVLADNVFNPLLVESGGLAATFVGHLLGVGPGRGIGLMMICSGLLMLIISVMAYANPHIRNVETEIPDVLPEEAVSEPSEGEERKPTPAAG
jgi:DHA3 family macrolide efflux protein-like MFS transporter